RDIPCTSPSLGWLFAAFAGCCAVAGGVAIKTLPKARAAISFKLVTALPPKFIVMSILGERCRFEYGGYAGIREFPNARELSGYSRILASSQIPLGRVLFN